MYSRRPGGCPAGVSPAAPRAGPPSGQPAGGQHLLGFEALVDRLAVFGGQRNFLRLLAQLFLDKR